MTHAEVGSVETSAGDTSAPSLTVASEFLAGQRD